MSALGGYHEYIGGHHKYIGGVQYIGGYHECIGGCSVHWLLMRVSIFFVCNTANTTQSTDKTGSGI